MDPEAAADSSSTRRGCSDAAAKSSGKNGRRERKQKFDVRKLLNIRANSGVGGDTVVRRASTNLESPSPTTTTVNNHETRRSGRVRAASQATVSPAVSEVTSPAEDGANNEQSAPVLGKRERKRKKFWDERDESLELAAAASATPTPPNKLVKKSDTVKKAASAPSTPPSVTVGMTTTPTPCAKTIASSKSSLGGAATRKERRPSPSHPGAGVQQSNGKTLDYLLVDLSLDPAVVAKQMVEGVNIPGPGVPIPVDSSNLPEGWQKHVIQRGIGVTKGKWDVFILNPSGKSFRSKNELQRYFEEHKLPYSIDDFDFTLDDTLKKLRFIWKQHLSQVSQAKSIDRQISKTPSESAVECLEAGIGVESETGQGLRCSIERCGKLFRNDRLLQMHVKHYHPEVIDHFSPDLLHVGDGHEARKLSSELHVNVKRLRLSDGDGEDSVDALASSVRSRPVSEETSQDASAPVPPTFRVSKRRQAQLKKVLSPPQQQQPHQPSSAPADSGGSYVDAFMSLLSAADEVGVTAGGDPASGGLGSAPPSYPPSEMGASVASEHLTNEEVVNCMCKRVEEDGLMIQCDICLCWQHGSCLGIEGDQVPEKYVCQICREPPGGRTKSRYGLDQDWLKEGKFATLPAPFAAASGTSSALQQANEAAFKKLSDLMADLSNLSRVLHSLRVKLHVACEQNNKVFMWSAPWRTKVTSLPAGVDKIDQDGLHCMKSDESATNGDFLMGEPLMGTEGDKMTSESREDCKNTSLHNGYGDGKAKFLVPHDNLEHDGDTDIDPSLIPSVSEVEQLLPIVIQASLEEAAGHLSQMGDDDATGKPPPSDHLFVPEQKRIDKDECRMFLLDHIEAMQKEVSAALDRVDERLVVIEKCDDVHSRLVQSTDLVNKTKAIAVVLMQDLNTARKMVGAV